MSDNLTGQPAIVPPKQTEELGHDKPKGNHTIIFIGLAIAVFLVIVFAGIAVGISFLLTPKKTSPPPPAQTSPPPQPLIIIPQSKSKFASDAGVLKIRDDLKILGTDLDTVNFFEPEITPPDISLNIHIQ